MKTVVIGLDGATFDLILPWIRRNRLPNLKKLVENGVSARLESCLPPVTSPNWKCYSTGKNPGKLGIFYWDNVDQENKRISFPMSRVNLHKEIWDYLSEEGNRVGIINMPLTYPPKKVNGFMISGPFGREENFTSPPELENRLKRDFNYEIHWRMGKLLSEQELREQMVSAIDTKFKVARVLLEEYDLDFLHLTIFYCNVLHHDFWNDKIVEEAWRLIDEDIAPFIRDDYNLFVISDHGSNEIKQVFYINTFLAREGYLKFNRRARLSSLLYRLGISRERLLKIIYALHIRKLAGKIVPRQATSFIPFKEGNVAQEDMGNKIDWTRANVVASGQGPVYILNQEKREELERELIEKLESLINPLTGDKIANKVYRREEIYSGQFLSEAPQLIIDQSPGTHIRGGFNFDKNCVFDKPSRWRAENKRDGIFIAYGPLIEKDKHLGEISILDVAPTILHLMKIPLPEDMDGRVVKEVFRVGSDPAEREIKYRQDEDYKARREKERIRKALKGLREKLP